MSRKQGLPTSLKIVLIVVVSLLALGAGYATASIFAESGSGDQMHTMPNGQTMSGPTAMSP